MKILLNDQEHATLSCNHLLGDPITHHSLTITNYGGFLNCREFNRPEEKEESSATSTNSAMDKIADTLSCLCEKWGDYSDSERQALIVTCCQQLRQ